MKEAKDGAKEALILGEEVGGAQQGRRGQIERSDRRRRALEFRNCF